MQMSSSPSFAHTLWLESHRAAFVYFPKVACTSWKLFIAQLLGLELPAVYADVHHQSHLPLPYVSGMEDNRQREFIALVEAGEVELAAVVRDPRERLLSAYLDKIKYHHKPDSYFSLDVQPAIRLFAGIADDQTPTLEQFLDWLLRGDSPHRSNDHWLPMSRILGRASGSTNRRYRLWTMNQMGVAADYFNSLFSASVAFPENQSLGPRPSWHSGSVLAKYWSPAVEESFQHLFRADLELYAFAQHGVPVQDIH